MKRLILAILPILLAAQIPVNVAQLVPSDLKKTLDFGVKWTSLLVNSFSAVSNDTSKKESIPEGVVTMTVTMAAIPDTPDIQIAVQRQICLAQVEIAEKAKEAARIQKDLDKKLRTLEIRVKTI
jgi:hypothetical protein